MSLKIHELDQVATFMGHYKCVHRNYHRLSENTIQPSKNSKLLMAIKLGISVY